MILSSLVLNQLYAFLEPLGLGIALGASFDLYRALRFQRKRRLSTASSVIIDCLFWIWAGVVCTAVFMVRHWGEIYLYTYLALACGFIAYIYFLSAYLLLFWIRLFRLIFTGFAGLYCLFIRLCSFVAAPLLWIISRGGKGGKNFTRFCSRILCGLRRRNI